MPTATMGWSNTSFRSSLGGMARPISRIARTSSGSKASKGVSGVWSRLFLQATDLDRWGDRKGAMQSYADLIQDVTMVIDCGRTSADVVLDLDDFQKRILIKIAACLQSRLNVLKCESDNGLTLGDIVKLKQIVKDFMIWRKPFPLVVSEEPDVPKDIISMSGDEAKGGFFNQENIPEVVGEQLCSRLPKVPGLSRVCLVIERIGLKNPDKYYRPFITISLRDSASVILSDLQNTPVSEEIDDFHLVFNSRYEVQRYREKIPKGSFIFFELRYRNDKGRTKTKCFTFLDMRELKEGKMCLKLFKGPVDYHRKNLSKMTVKALYLQLNIILVDENS